MQKDKSRLSGYDEANLLGRGLFRSEACPKKNAIGAIKGS